MEQVRVLNNLNLNNYEHKRPVAASKYELLATRNFKKRIGFKSVVHYCIDN